MPQIDLNATSVPPAPAIDASGNYNSVHVPNGQDRTSAADQAALSVDGVSTLKVTIAPSGAFVRFSNPA